MVDRGSPGDSRRGGLHLAALGVVFGDIGTSPLYALRECLSGAHGVTPTPENVLGVLSLVVWALMLIVSFKYLTFIMRASDHGEGGIFALLALVPASMRVSAAGRLRWPALLVMFGAGLLYGDGMITPSISVLSAVEGLESTAPALRPLVIPLTCGILIGLFLLQRRGTGSVGRLFGPVMAAWFVAIGVAGALGLRQHPHALVALNPVYAARFFMVHGLRGALVLGFVVLAVTGAEALYADMGHFGAAPIRRSWFVLVLPSLLLSYLGQGALLLAKPRLADSNPFFALVPAGAWTGALVVLSTAATIIASQSLISGAFSMTHQAVQLGFLPSMTVRHTSSTHEGQIYLPQINVLLALACLLLVLTFRHSSRLASAYGLAVTGTMTITSLVFFEVSRATWRWPLWKSLGLLLIFLSFDVPFLGANLFKLVDGGFIPLLVGLAFFVVMETWKRGRRIYGERMRAAAPEAATFLRGCEAGIARSRGTGVFLTGQERGIPPALLLLREDLQVVPETAVLLTIRIAHQARVGSPEPSLEPLGAGIYRAIIEFGFMEYPNVPREVAQMAARHGVPADPDRVTYFASRNIFQATASGQMGRWSEALFAFLARNARPVTERLALPPERVIEIGSRIDL